MHDSGSDLAAIRQRRLELLEQQRAQFGLHAPAHVTMEIEQLQAEIDEVQQQRVQLIFDANDLNLEPPPLAKGLILLVSPLRQGDALQSLNTYQAIDYHRGPLERCWLIATEKSKATADDLARFFGTYRVRCSVHAIANAADALETYTTVTAIYAQLHEDHLTPEDVIADITGGTKAMTAGMVLACGSLRAMQYMLYGTPGTPSLPVRLHTRQDVP